MSFEKIVKNLLESQKSNSSLWSDMVGMVVESDTYKKEFEPGKVMLEDKAKVIVNHEFKRKEQDLYQDYWRSYHDECRDLTQQFNAGKISRQDKNNKVQSTYRAHRDHIDRLGEALGNSTYRSCKSVLKNATRYGIPLMDAQGNIEGKSAVESRIKAAKDEADLDPRMVLGRIKNLISQAQYKTQSVYYNDKYRRSDMDTIKKDLTELLVSTRGLDRFLVRRLEELKDSNSDT